MTTTSTNERVNELLALSNHIYSALDTHVQGETLARHILRRGINAAAHLLQGDASPQKAGEVFKSVLHEHLSRGGVHVSDFQVFPTYRQQLPTLANAPRIPAGKLDSLATTYADVERQTLDSRGNPERNARHVGHLAALALPYAAKYYPRLSQGKVALYCLVHDILEAYTGDVSTLGISHEQLAHKEASEQQALALLSIEYGQQWPQFVATVQAYEHLADDEAKFVKIFDKLDPSFSHIATRGIVLTATYHYQNPMDFFAAIQTTTHRIEQGKYSDSFPLLLEDRQTLLQCVADSTEWPQQ